MSLGDVVRLTLGMVRFRWRTVLGAVVVPMLPAHLVAAVIQVPFVERMNRWLVEVQSSLSANVQLPAGWAEIMIALLALGVLLAVINLLATAAVTRAAADIYGGRQTPVREILIGALRRLPSVLAAHLLYLLAIFAVVMVGLAFSFGFFAGGAGGGAMAFIGLVVVVGAVAAALFVTVRWSLLMPALMVEDAGAMQALGRSWRLVAGSGWRVLGYLLAIGLVVGLAGAVVIELGSALLGRTAVTLDGTALLAHGLLSAAVTIVLAPVLPIALTLLYFDLRWRRDKPPRG